MCVCLCVCVCVCVGGGMSLVPPAQKKLKKDEDLSLKRFGYFVYFFCNLTDIKKLKSFKDYDVCTINFFRMGHTLERNLTKLVYVWKEKNPKLNIFISSLFQGKKS